MVACGVGRCVIGWFGEEWGGYKVGRVWNGEGATNYQRPNGSTQSALLTNPSAHSLTHTLEVALLHVPLGEGGWTLACVAGMYVFMKLLCIYACVGVCVPMCLSVCVRVQGGKRAHKQMSRQAVGPACNRKTDGQQTVSKARKTCKRTNGNGNRTD